MMPEFRELEVGFPAPATLVWDRDELVDVTTGQRASLDGSVSRRTLNIAYSFDRALGLRTADAFWAIIYTNRGTKAVLMKNGLVHRELNRSYYCAESYDYPIAMCENRAGQPVVIHCPHEFNTIEVEDAESGESHYRVKSRQMEFHSRLAKSADGRFLLDAGWFWHPLCGACVFDLSLAPANSSAIGERVAFSTSNYEIDSAAFLDKSRLVVSSASDDAGEELEPDALRPKQLGVWSLIERRWESRVQLNEPTGAIMPWKDWIVSFYGHPKLIELGTGQIVHRWNQVYSGKQVGPIDLGDPPPPPMALDWHRGRFAVAGSNKITVVTL
jgi:hypothetical protein